MGSKQNRGKYQPGSEAYKFRVWKQTGYTDDDSKSGRTENSAGEISGRDGETMAVTRLMHMKESPNYKPQHLVNAIKYILDVRNDGAKTD